MGRYFKHHFAYEEGLSILSLENPENLTTAKIKNNSICRIRWINP